MSNQIQAKNQKKKTPVSKAMQSGAPPPRKKQQARKNTQPQRKNRYVKPQLKVEAPVVPNPGLRQNVSVACRFDPMSIDLAYAAIYSWYCSKGFMYFSPHEDQDPVAFVSGLNYLFVSICNAIKSGELSATKAPAFAIDMFSALRGKTLRFLSYGELSYSWSAPPSWDAMPDIPIQTADWKATIISFDNEQYNSPAQVVTYSATQDNYSYFLTKAGGVTGNEQSNIVEVAKYKSKLSSDVSSFARNYAYNGLAPSKSGAYYKDVENEVTITAPLWSAFAVYDFDGIESRVPTKLHAYGGDAALAAGWPLHSAFISHFNKRAPAFKCIDFDWICGMLTQWVCLALPKAQSLGEGNVPVGYQIPCSYQDFRIMLRQALLNVFDAQYAVQFTGPLNFGTNNNGFVPFQVNGHCYGGQPFSTMRVPVLLRENLNALRPRTLKTARKGGSKINFTTYIPILGRYVTDVPVEPQYKGADGVILPLFTTAIQDPINLVDGTTAPSTYINLNGSHYQTVLSVWDSVVEKLAPVTANTTSIVGDAGPMGLGALYYTAVVEPGNAGPSLQGKEHLKSPYLANVRNVPSKVASQKDVRNPKSDIKALPPATLVSETMTHATASIPPSAEMQAMLDSLIVPVIRLDPNDASDQISLQMYQIETKEVISSRYLANPNYGGGGVWTRLSKLAGMCVTGVGKETTAEYDELFRLLSRHNDAGMLSGLLGGLAKTLLPPDAHGIVDVVADVLPF